MNLHATSFVWGLLGHQRIGSERRTRTLGLGAAVREFNDRAVPGLGGVWFGKELFLALLGIRVAEELRSRNRRFQNIETANAVEALGCWLAMLNHKGARDPRLRGTTKLRGKSDFSFLIARRPGFYVTQPMRQATVQSLRAFGFVESPGERFNSYACTEIGEEFIEAVCGLNRPFNRRVLDHLVNWGEGQDAGTSAPLTNVLSPLTGMPKRACQILRHQLVTGVGTDPKRRQQALAWVEELRANDKTAGSWKKNTKTIDEDHWHDLQAGGYFFQTRDAAIRLLEEIEVQLAKEKAASRRLSLDSPLSEVVLRLCNELRKCAEAFHRYGHDPSPLQLAGSFCRECLDGDDPAVIEKLVARDGRVLRLRHREIAPGIAFRVDRASANETSRSAEEEGVETEFSDQIQLPPGISHRVRNLYLLNLDLRGELNHWLGTTEKSGATL